MNARSTQASVAGRRPIQGDVEAVWYRAPQLTLPIPDVREFSPTDYRQPPIN